MTSFAEVFAGVYTTVAAHSQHQDAGNTDQIMALYTPDAVLEVPGMGVFEGADAIRAAWDDWKPKGLQRHMPVNIVITDWTDEEARATTDVVFLAQGDTGWAVQIVARYQDVFRPVDGRWLLVRRAVDFKGKRVAVVGTGSSGVQVVPKIADEVASLTVYQRSPNWVTPLVNRPISDEEQARAAAELRLDASTPSTSRTGGFLHHPLRQDLRGVSKEERWAHYESVWQRSAGSTSSVTTTRDIFDQSRDQRRLLRVPRREDPQHRQGPGNRREADPQGRPLRRQAPPVRHRLLRGLQQAQCVSHRPQGDADAAGDRDRHRDSGRPARVRHDHLGDRVRLRHRRPAADGRRRPRRAHAQRSLGRRAADRISA